ncbi:hypothetical protein CONLIGDRAFT_426445 [Coniochaeta ligniaria NRRL 30616]|uniref:DUF1168-domain-containing protein n=1 Tax=Coniochaeta ligniaria NRRL 30616 TaxID=1408157 RepID=A0A1J7JIB3_9PEZI|nr:hypothetical protein CONLIGDRAFT_426445 [Coniochaeta ligniaria NRRL 30616]
MSANIPESIPTSSDRHSKRAVKKRALTPVSQQAATVESLFARPDQEIRLPQSGSAVAARRAVPEIVTNVQGSSAGAGSGEFHVYKASRRREYERLRQMDEEVRKETEAEEFERLRREREERDAEKTRRNRERREKKKGKRGNKGTAAGGEAGGKAKILPRIQVDGEDGESKRDGGDANAGAEKAAGANGASEQPGLLIHDDDD